MSDLDDALASLKRQGIEVSAAGVHPHGMCMSVHGFMLTNAEILALYRGKRLTRAGIEDYVRAEDARKRG